MPKIVTVKRDRTFLGAALLYMPRIVAVIVIPGLKISSALQYLSISN